MEKKYVTYNEVRVVLFLEHTSFWASQVHKQCQANSEKILRDFKPNLMVAIGGGGYVPARILRYDHACYLSLPTKGPM